MNRLEHGNRPSGTLTCEAVKPNLKTCCVCKVAKSGEDFYENKRRKGGLASECRTCVSAYNKVRYAGNPHVKRNSRASVLRRQYGITHEDVDRMLTDQGNRCPVCSRAFTESFSHHVDHDHKTGTVRALLCGPCNRAIGLMQEDTAALRAAASYLEVYRSPH